MIVGQSAIQKVEFDPGNLNLNLFNVTLHQPVSVAARSKVWVCGRSPAEIVGSNPTGGVDVCLL